MTKFWWQSGSRIRIQIATLVRRGLAEVCTVPVLLVLYGTPVSETVMAKRLIESTSAQVDDATTETDWSSQVTNTRQFHSRHSNKLTTLTTHTMRMYCISLTVSLQSLWFCAGGRKNNRLLRLSRIFARYLQVQQGNQLQLTLKRQSKR